MLSVNVNKACFIKSAVSRNQFVNSSLPVVVFAGKSNVGKSSVINRLLNRKNFARVGSEPGKTIHINYFLIGDNVYFVDLPGYGYAKVSDSEKLRWAALIEDFFNGGSRIDTGILIVDARHKPTENDIMMAHYFTESSCSFIVVANKTDKLKKQEISEALINIRETLVLPDEVKIIPFSAENGQGKNELLTEISSNL